MVFFFFLWGGGCFIENAVGRIALREKGMRLRGDRVYLRDSG